MAIDCHGAGGVDAVEWWHRDSCRAALEFALMMAASVMAMAPIFLLFFSMQRKVIEGLASSGLKG